MPYSNDGKHTMLAKLVGKATPADEVTHLSLHTADPGTTGANEVTGGGYERIAVTEADWDAPDEGEVVLNNDKTFSGPAEGGATHFGTWTALTDGTFLGGGANSGDQAFNAEGEYILRSGTKADLNA